MHKMYLHSNYALSENDTAECALFGVIAHMDDENVCYDALDIATRFCNGNLDFDNIVGFFRMVIYDKETGKQYYFCDNCGSMRFLVDKETNTVHDSFLSAIENRHGNIAPCYDAIAQKFAWLRTMDDTTVVEGIVKLGAHFYMEQDGEKLTEHKKGLKTFAQHRTDLDAKRITDILCKALEGQRIGAVITGGADSRVILSYLYDIGKKPDLIITGRDDNPDVPIAKQIAEKLNLPLAVYNPDEVEDCWLEKSFFESDGLYDTVAYYRHLRKSQLSDEIGYHYEFGGVGGEYYKNFYPRYRRRGNIFFSSPQKAFDAICKVPFSAPWIGESVAKEAGNVRGYVYDYMVRATGESGKQVMNNTGNFYMMGGLSDIANPISKSVVKIDPLIDRNSISAALDESMSPFYALCMWNRREVAKYCPELSDIPRDVGQTLSMDKKVIRKERSDLRKLFLSRVMQKLKNRNVNFNAKYWDNDFSRAKQTKEFEEALTACKKLGIIAQDATAESIKTNITGHIINIGLIFSRYSKEV